MPSNKNAVIRYMYLDQMLSDRYHKYTCEDLLKKVNERLEFAGYPTVGGDKSDYEHYIRSGKRVIQLDLQALQEEPFNMQIDNSDSTWVREIEYAIELHKNIVPIYFGGITGLKADEIPSCIQRLAFENAVQYVHQYADASFDRLASRLSKEPIALPKWSKWLIGAVAAGGLAAGGYTAIDNAADLKPGEVYVVNSSSSKSYHNNRNCATLKNAKHRIKKVPKDEAIRDGKKPCKKCFK